MWFFYAARLGNIGEMKREQVLKEGKLDRFVARVIVNKIGCVSKEVSD